MERTSRTRWLPATALALALCGAARADVVHLTTGRSVSGTIVSEDETQVVIRTPDGRVTFPRAMVRSVERQGEAQTLLALARERVRAGAFDEAEELFEQAIAAGDAQVTQQARDELQTLRGKRDRARANRRAPREPLPLPAGTGGKPVEGGSLQEQFDLAREALDRKDGLRAQRLLQPLVDGNPDDPVLRYLLGRAYELMRRDDPARAEYQRVLGREFARDGRPAAWLGELARRQVAGERLLSSSPGAGPEWKRVETLNFAIYHRFERVEDWFGKEPEDALTDVLERLEVRTRDLRLAGRIQVVMHLTAEDYQASSQLTHAAAHAARVMAPDGLLRVITAYPSREFYRTTYRHEMAHVVLYDVHPGLPGWAHEGAAQYVEPLDQRARAHALAVGARRDRLLPTAADFLSGKVERGRTRDAVRRYYAQALVIFQALTELSGGPRQALRLCERIEADGPGPALQAARLTTDEVEAAMQRVLDAPPR